MRGFLWGVTAAVLSIALATPAAAERFKLSDALALAYSTNPELEAQRARVRQADDAVAEARGGWRPSIGGSASYGFERADSNLGQTLNITPLDARATVSQPVLTGGQAYAQVQRAIALVRAARADLLNAEQQVLFAAASAYMDVVRDVIALRLHQDDVSILTRQREATKTQLDAGAATKTDLQEVEVRLAGAQADLATAQSQLTQSRDSFERVIGRPPETLEELPALPWLPGSQEQAMSLSLRLAPRIQSAQANDKAAQYGVDNAVGALLPHASIVAQYDYTRDSLNSPFGSNEFGVVTKGNALSVLGQISVPLYDGGADTARIREAKEAKSQSRLNIYDADQATRQVTKDSWAAFHAALTSVSFNEHRVTSSLAALDGVIQQQHQGERSILDILNAEQEKLAAQVALNSSRHDMVVSSYQLLAAVGELTAKQLALKVKIYDPNDHYNQNSASWIDFGG
ncbi:MAG TPA: TolC family outer membrane protein [Rhizomicrobium sp.]|nr:TolC family outer membrane protein [Rhizomicrobium sp.]